MVQDEIDDEISRTEAADNETGFTVSPVAESDAVPALAAESATLDIDTPADTAVESGAVIPAAADDTEAGAATPQPDAAASADNAPYDVAHNADGTRHVQLVGEGDDHLQLDFNGTSWVEVDNSDKARMYYDLHSNGDVLSIQGLAPFYVLLGDATQVRVTLNAMPVNFNARIRSDNTARFVVGLDEARVAYAGVAR